jgi:hypothetical protein
MQQANRFLELYHSRNDIVFLLHIKTIITVSFQFIRFSLINAITDDRLRLFLFLFGKKVRVALGETFAWG